MKILLIGWFGAFKKDILKYKNLYEKLGVKNIEICHYPLYQGLSFSGWSQFRKINSEPKDFDIFHCFSGGSLMAYNLIKCGWSYNKIIYDSGPMFPTTDCTINYLCEYNCISNITKKYIRSPIDFALNLDMKLNPNLHTTMSKLEPDYNKSLLYTNTPKLIINSKSDKIIMQCQVNDFANKSNTESRMFDKSPHVQHFRYHPEEYTELINTFIKK